MNKGNEIVVRKNIKDLQYFGCMGVSFERSKTNPSIKLWEKNKHQVVKISLEFGY